MGGGIARKKRIDEDFVGIGFDVEAGMPEPLNFSFHAPDHLKLREGEALRGLSQSASFTPAIKIIVGVDFAGKVKPVTI